MQTINTSRVTSLSRYVTAEMPNESKFVNEGSYTVCLTSMYEVFDVFKKGHEHPPPIQSSLLMYPYLLMSPLNVFFLEEVNKTTYMNINKQNHEQIKIKFNTFRVFHEILI